MKKLIFLSGLCIFLAFCRAEAQQQGGGDPAAMMQRYKERVKPQLIEKTKITDAQADKVLEINMNARQQMRGMRDLSDDDKKKKMEEVRADINKQYKAIPLTDDQIKEVNSFFDEQRKLMQQQRQQFGNN